MQQVLRDKFGQRLGEIRPNGPYLSAYGRQGNRLGYFYATTNTTYDNNGKTVGRGNLLSSLIYEAR